MTIEDVRDMIARIAEGAASGDDELAHSLEDDLYEQVLRAIANMENLHNSVSLCREALTTKELTFPRHCA